MNGMSPLGSMMQGVQQGTQQAQSLLPSTYQPQGKAKPRNPFQGSIDLHVDSLLGLGKQIKDQGDRFRGIGEDIYLIAVKLAKLNQKLNDVVEEEAK